MMQPWLVPTPRHLSHVPATSVSATGARHRIPSLLMAQILLACWGMSGCASDQSATSGVKEPIKPQATALNYDATTVAKAGSSSLEEALEAHADVGFEEADLAEEQDTSVEGGEPGDEISHNTTQGIPLEMNADVERWIEYFTVKDAERFRRFMERGQKYKAMITAVLKDQGIPTEIFYQAMIESGFATHATSHASAVGVWQFIRETGRRYGLRVDHYVDERRDPMRATIAAALYLKDLYNVFQSWYLAMAAYNAGEGRILGAIMRAKTRDFWEMVRMRALPSETMNYIPKFLAATTIGHNPERYGFNDVGAETMPTLASVAVPSPVRLTDVAKTTGIPLAALKEANPHLLRGITPPGVATYRLWIPKPQVEAVENQLEQLAELRLKGISAKRLASHSSGRNRPETYMVRRGDTLGRIAGAYGISVAALKKINGLKSSKLLVGQRLKLWSEANYRSYRVRRGDNLSAIARRFNVSVGHIKKVNRLTRDRVYVGQVLKVGDERI